MAIKIVGDRAGRPDYSQTVEKLSSPLPPKPIIGTTNTLYWSTLFDIPPLSSVVFEPVDPYGNFFPNKGKVFRLKKIVVSTLADVLLLVALKEAWEPKNYAVNVYNFAMKADYQKVEIDPEAYSIKHPNWFVFSIDNPDVETRRVFIYWIGVEEPL